MQSTGWMQSTAAEFRRPLLRERALCLGMVLGEPEPCETCTRIDPGLRRVGVCRRLQRLLDGAERQWCDFGKGIGQFVRPKGISVDKDDNLYVVDAGFENVQIFNSNNKLLMFFGGPYNGPGDMWLPAKVHVDYENMQYFKKWVSPEYELSYLIYVANQYGPDKISVYGAVKPATK